MASSFIAKAIKERCKDDNNMQQLLMDLLEFNLTGRSWYKEEYKDIIKKYSEQREDSDED